ncbi:uncharacterized protein LOC128558538 isoform X2 [Mercenaria mercenaria]|uniref:uncharacterized protein LOC128558538 isoform X2 n=1 Tax=Mercenaria mercenaria TaxID=6596 RepID=UPI00234EA460|nr:uncharacterized protein LOC128558538 isoform X2 [Mercenaria mercenaria]
MDGNIETQHGFMSTDDIPFHFLRRETHRRLLDIWRRIHTHFMIYDRRNMEDELLRLITFLHFPECSGQDIRVLAIAGFYYFGERDIVVCYCCGLWKRNWTRADEPWTIHTRLSAACLFIRNNRQVNRPYYGITERGLRHLEQTTELLQQTAIASGPSFVRSGSEIQAGIISDINQVGRERHNNQNIERIERQNVLPVANLQMRETHVGGFHMSAERRYAHGLYIDIETRIINIANERRNITYNASHFGRGINSTEYANMAQSQQYMVSSENSSEHLANMETSVEREYVSDENFDEEADWSRVQNSRLTFHSIQEQEQSTSGDETAPKQVITVSTTLRNNNFTRRLSRSISAPSPHQYSCRSSSHIYSEHTNYPDGSANACNSETCVFSESNDLASEEVKHIEQSGLSVDSENSYIFWANETEERALPSSDHETNIVTYDNTSYGTPDSDETLLKRNHLDEEMMEAHADIDTNKVLGVPECYDRTSFTGCGTGTPTTNIKHSETTSVEGIEEQFHLSGNTYTTESDIKCETVASHTGRGINSTEYANMAQSPLYMVSSENNSEHFANLETSVEREYAVEEHFDEEADRSSVQNSRLTFHSIQEQKQSTSRDETAPKQVITVPTNLTNNNFKRRLSRSISAPSPHQYSCRSSSHIYSEHANYQDGSANACNSETCVFSESNDLASEVVKDIEQSGLSADSENSYLFRASETEEGALPSSDHETNIVTYDNTSYGTSDSDETLLKRHHLEQEMMEAHADIDTNKVSGVPECYDRTSFTGCGTGTPTTNIKHSETTSVEGIEEQFHLSGNTYTAESDIKSEKVASHTRRGINSTEYANMAQSPLYMASSKNNSEHLANLETSVEREYATEEHFDEEADRSSVQNSRSTFYSIQEQEHSTSRDETAPKQVITVPTTLRNNNFTRRLSRSISAPSPHQYSCRSPSHIYAENTNYQDGYHRSANESTNACNSETCVFSESNDLASDEVNEGSSVISVSHVNDRARVETEETEITEEECNKCKERSTQNENNLKNVSVLLNRPNETEILTPEFNSIHQQNIASIAQMQRKPDAFQKASPLDISYEAPMHDLVLKSNDSSKADRERQPGAMFQNAGPESYMGCDDICLRPKSKSRQRHFSEGDSPHLIPTVPRAESRRRAVKNNSADTGFYNADKEIVDALCNQEDNEESGYAGIQPPENLPVMLRGPENNICIRTKLKARQRHLSEGDSPDFVPIGPRHKPLQNYPTVESRRRSFRNNSASPSEQLADAGFYSAGKDRIRCFSCETEFQYSQLENDIWIEHAKASPRCEYLLQRKGQDFVKAVLRDDAILVQLHLKILTTESRRICFSADRTSEDENEAVSEEALEGVVLKCD